MKIDIQDESFSFLNLKVNIISLFEKGFKNEI